jgi:hypothetical protein
LAGLVACQAADLPAENAFVGSDALLDTSTADTPQDNVGESLDDAGGPESEETVAPGLDAGVEELEDSAAPEIVDLADLADSSAVDAATDAVATPDGALESDDGGALSTDTSDTALPDADASAVADIDAAIPDAPPSCQEPCSDGNPCTSGDHCAAGTCVGGAVKTCPATGDPCLVAVCQPATPTTTTCGTEPASPGTTCDDGSVCTTADACDGKGACGGTPMDCKAMDGPCVVGTCDETTVACVKKKKAEGAACDDGNACTVVDACSNGQCAGSQDACQGERIDLDQGGSVGVSVASVGFGRYLTHWVGTKDGHSGARWTDADGSREGEQLTVANSGSGVQGPGTAAPCRTIAVTADGSALVTHVGKTYAKVPCDPNNEPVSIPLGPIRATLFGALGAPSAGPSDLLALHVNLQQVGWCGGLSGGITALRSQALAFSDGSLASLSSWVGIVGGAGATQKPQVPPAAAINFVAATSKIVGGGATNLANSDKFASFDARVIPDGSDGFVLSWSSSSAAHARLFSKTGQGLGSGPIEVATGTTDNTRVLPFDDASYVVAYECVGVDGSGYGLCQRRIGPNGTPTGPATQVNTATAGDQRLGEIALLPKGGYVIVWHDTEGDGQGAGIKARRFLADGNANGGEFQVNTLTPGSQLNPSVATFEDGSFVVAWRDDQGAVWTRRFDKTAKPTPGSPERPLAQSPAGTQTAPKLAALGNTVAAVWQSVPAPGLPAEVRLRVFDGKGQELKAEVVAATSPTTAMPAPVMAAGGGRFALAWVQGVGSEGDTKLQARWFDAKAAPLPPEMIVVSAAPGPHNAPAAAISPAGKTVFAWSEGAGAAADVFARAFDGQGQPISTKTGLAQTVANAQGKPSIAVAEGGFVVAWQSKLADGSGEGVYLRKLDQDGQPQGKEVQANVTTQGDQRAPTVAALGGTIAVCWEGWEADGAGSWGVVCRLFAAADLAPSTPEFAPHPASPSLDQTLPAVAMVAKSNVLVAWTAAGVDGAGTAVQAVHVDSGGKPLGPRVQVNRAKQGDQLAPAITVLTGEQVVLAWQSAGQEGKDDVGGVHVRWLAGP